MCRNSVYVYYILHIINLPTEIFPSLLRLSYLPNFGCSPNQPYPSKNVKNRPKIQPSVTAVDFPKDKATDEFLKRSYLVNTQHVVVCIGKHHTMCDICFDVFPILWRFSKPFPGGRDRSEEWRRQILLIFRRSSVEMDVYTISAVVVAVADRGFNS